MKEITVTEPAFVTRFSCSGSACRDHCCKGWKITLDKTTVKKYLTSKDVTIREIAKNNIILLKKAPNNWGRLNYHLGQEAALIWMTIVCARYKKHWGLKH